MESQRNLTSSRVRHEETTLRILALAPALLILLWAYAALSKLLDYTAFQGQLANQNIPAELAGTLAWGLPLAELATCGLLLFRRTMYTGLLLSLIMLSVFTVYILLVLLGTWDRIPCSCGGVLSHLSWGFHLGFNLFFLLLTASALRHTD